MERGLKSAMQSGLKSAIQCSLNLWRGGGARFNRDIDRKRVAEEDSIFVSHAPYACDRSVLIAGNHQLNRDLALCASWDRFREGHGTASQRVAAKVVKGESSAPGASARVLDEPGLRELFASLHLCSIGNGHILDPQQVVAGICRRWSLKRGGDFWRRERWFDDLWGGGCGRSRRQRLGQR